MSAGTGFSILGLYVLGRSVLGSLVLGLVIGLVIGLSRGYRPPPRVGPSRVLALQLSPPVAEVLQREPVLFAIASLRQATKLPHLKVAAPERPRSRPLFQSKWQRLLLVT